MTHQQNKTERFLSVCISQTVLEIWVIHPKGHRCHKFDVTQMFQSLHSHRNMGCIWTVKKRSGFYPSVHIAHTTTGSCLGIWDNACVRLIKKNKKKTVTVGKTTVLMGIIVDAFIEKYLQMHGSRHIIYTRAYSCIHSSRRLSYRVWHDGNMSANRMYFLFSHW